MATARPPHSFSQTRPVAGDTLSHHTVVESNSSTTPSTTTTARLDRPPEHQRSNQTYCILQYLVQHPLRVTYLSMMVSFLRLDDTSWEYIRHLRTHAETAEILQPTLPQLYQLPTDLALLLEGIRSDPDWKNIRNLAIECLSVGKTPLLARPISIRSSGFSPRSSLLSNVSTIPSTEENSNRSSVTSITSLNSLQQSPGPATPQDQADDTMYTPGSVSSPNVSTPPAVPPKDDRDQLCLSRGCGKAYKRFGDLRNHVLRHHPESQQALAIAPEATLSYVPKQPKRQLFGEIPMAADGLSDVISHRTDHPLSPAELETILKSSTFDGMSQDDLAALNHFTHSDVDVLAYDLGMFGGANPISPPPMPHQDTIMGGTSSNGPPPVPPSTVSRTFSNAKLGRKETRDSRLIRGNSAG